MPALPAGPWVRVVSFFSDADSEWQNVDWWIVTGSPISGFDIKAFAAAYDTAFLSTLQACISDSVNINGVNLYYNNTVYTAVGLTNPATQGSLGGARIPTEDAIIVRRQVQLPGPSGRGRNFYSGLADSSVVGSRVSSAALSAFNALITAFKAGFTYGGLTCKPALYVRKTNQLYPPVDIQVETILGHITRRRPTR